MSRPSNNAVSTLDMLRSIDSNDKFIGKYGQMAKLSTHDVIANIALIMGAFGKVSSTASTLGSRVTGKEKDVSVASVRFPATRGERNNQ